MSRTRVQGLVFALAVAAIFSVNAYAFGPSSLNGTYSFAVDGYMRDNNNGETGNLAFAGLITFNGSGAVKQIDLSVSAFDRAGDAENCVISGAANAGLSFYAVNPDGSGSLSIGIPLNSCLDNSQSSNGSIQFNLFLSSSHSGTGVEKLISNGTFSNLTDQSGDSIANLLLTGTMVHQ